MQPRLGRAAGLVFGALLSIAIVGFFTGVSQPRSPAGYHRPAGADERAQAPVPRAPSNAELAGGRFGINRSRQPAVFAGLAQQRRALTEEVIVPEGAQEAALARRAETRAYAGAPPVVPHAVGGERSSTACLSCHLEGLQIDDRTAPAMSHSDQRVSCTQCHALASGGPPVAQALPLYVQANAFAGEPEPSGGPRAWPGAPPAIPHSTFMRARCDSCHGVLANGLATTHPYRQQCRQCHVQAATLDQQPRSTVGLETHGRRKGDSDG